MISRGFRKRRDEEAKQEMEARDNYEDVEDRVEDQAETPERRAERQSPPEPDEAGEHQTLLTRIWRSIRGT